MLTDVSLLLAIAASYPVSASPIVFTPTSTTRAFNAADAPVSTSTSTGVRLVADVTDPFNALAQDVQNMALQAYHAGSNYRVPMLHKPDAQNPGRVFYYDRPAQSSSSILLTDSFSAETPANSTANPPVSFGLTVQSPSDFIVPEYPHEHGVSFFAGSGDATPVALADTGTPYGALYLLNMQGSGTFMACNRTIPYYSLETGLTLEYLYDSDTSSLGEAPVVPDNCVPIRLVLVCADLPAVPPGSESSHASAQQVSCYTDMSGGA
ncbi:uncharacterized protein SPSK_01249 [Sporothrix schenckii 1099-18]|uniref:DUF7907 domain-containing protein n=2 Tax=Sporothrix schenckii TaxID=29908 RepID=U7PP94_SPOS1|nr:uncharacterized protein SPSK_01249 [Sporothrix schenckii 1099-18]ERS96559.1 hypothetical protein HMPREF1624_06765 [Sporothrix schenckii ATCC 58251]KJR81238.1 hypothetical protein SPSK_01249 [Sporothrix schenckii 1099-18]